MTKRSELRPFDWFSNELNTAVERTEHSRCAIDAWSLSPAAKYITLKLHLRVNWCISGQVGNAKLLAAGGTRIELALGTSF